MLLIAFAKKILGVSPSRPPAWWNLLRKLVPHGEEPGDVALADKNPDTFIEDNSLAGIPVLLRDGIGEGADWSQVPYKLDADKARKVIDYASNHSDFIITETASNDSSGPVTKLYLKPFPDDSDGDFILEYATGSGTGSDKIIRKVDPNVLKRAERALP